MWLTVAVCIEICGPPLTILLLRHDGVAQGQQAEEVGRLGVVAHHQIHEALVVKQEVIVRIRKVREVDGRRFL